MPFDFGYSLPRVRRHWTFYVGIQALIFVKVVVFFFLFGAGISYAGQPLALNIPFAALPVFGSPLHVVDYLFHQLMHVLIAVWVFLVAKHAKRIDGPTYLGLFLVATVLHNVGYWLTGAHPSVAYSVVDFIIDLASLFVFLGFFRVLLRGWPVLRRVSIPVVD